MSSHTPLSENDFLWGVSSSGYQHEGGYNNLGEPLNNWAQWEKTRHVAPSGRSVDFWKLYREDFKLAKSMGVNSFRLGIEWSRVQPTLDIRSRKIPPYNVDALNHYAEILQAAREEGVEPLVTLHHFTHPNWLGPDPWLKEENVELLTSHCVETVEWMNRHLVGCGQEPLRWLITINEANILVLNQYILGIFPGSFRRGPLFAQHALVNLYTAHVRIYTSIKNSTATTAGAMCRFDQ
ncbi:family 1 glycosylhydrolase [Oscillatoria amoena NRMC-F 0135]|nr:family 1 glycosylhydrolase [Oscillatoria amoena NRMC-F 0135]